MACRDCGLEFDRKGGERDCPACIASKARGECLDCGVAIVREPGRRGPLPRRCEKCRSVHKGRQAYRYVRNRMELDPGFAEHERAMQRERVRRARAKNPEKYRQQDREAKARRYADPVTRKKIQEQSRIARIARMYGLTRIEYEMLTARHGGTCAICKLKTDALCIDHDHDTGKVRGVLCVDCNLGLGRFKDNPDRLRGAIKYLSRYG